MWLESAPDDKMSFDEADGKLDVNWLMEPVPADGPVDEPQMPDEDEETEPVEDEAEEAEEAAGEVPVRAAASDEMSGDDPIGSSPMHLLDEAEERIGTIEGMVADIILADVQDEVFLGEPEDEDESTDAEPDEEIVGEDVDEEEDQKDAKRAAAVRAANQGSVVQGLAGMLKRAVTAAAIAAEEAVGDNPEEAAPGDEGGGQADEVQNRIEGLMERIQKLEESIASLLNTQMEDTELVDLPEDDDPSTIVEGESDEDG